MKRLSIFSLLIALCTGVMAGPSMAATPPDVVVSIKPVHSLVAGVMEGVGEPDLIIQGGASPHSYQMRPSEAAALSQADIIIWVGEYIETFLKRPITNLGSESEAIALTEIPGISLLRFREGAVWVKNEGHDEHGHDEHGHDEHGHDEHGHDEHGHDEHGHDEHGHDEHGHDEHGHDEHGHDEHGHDEHGHDEHGHDEHGHDEHGHDEHGHDEHGHDEHGHDEHGHDEHGHDEHGHDEHDHAGEIDGHIWLDHANSRRIVEFVADLLARQDPERAATYQRNKVATIERIDALERKLRSRLAPVQDRPFLVFHDAYQYFERTFDLKGLGAITFGPDRRPSAMRLTALRNALIEHDIGCVFTEPQFKPDLAFTVIEGTKTRTAEIDPLGADIEAGSDAWFNIIDRLGTTIADCLSGKG